MKLCFYVGEFFLAVVLVLLYYVFIETKAIKKYTKNNIPVDLKLFIHTQNIDVRKIKYKKLMKLVAIINAIDVGIVLLITNITSNILLKFFIAVPAIFLIIFISYKGVGYILKKKGLTKNES